MTRKHFVLSKDDPLVQQFKEGLEAWEEPIKPRGPTRGIRVRGAVRTRGAAKLGRAPGKPSFALPDDDPVVEQFRKGLEDWEKPL